MSKAVAIDDLFDSIGEWGAAFVATVGDDDRIRLVALRPEVVTQPHGRVLRFTNAGGGTIVNATTRDRISMAFPPHPGSDGFSLIVDGVATVDVSTLEVRPVSAVLHRPAP